MRLPTRHLHRAFPQLDRFDDRRAQAFVAAVNARWSTRIVRWIVIVAITLIAATAGIKLTPFLIAPDFSRWLVGLMACVITIITGVLGMSLGFMLRDALLSSAVNRLIARRRLCLSCGYSLLGMPVSDDLQVTCPECQTSTVADPAFGEIAIDAAGRRTFAPRPSRTYLRRKVRHRRFRRLALRTTKWTVIVCLCAMGVLWAGWTLWLHRTARQARAHLTPPNDPATLAQASTLKGWGLSVMPPNNGWDAITASFERFLGNTFETTQPSYPRDPLREFELARQREQRDGPLTWALNPFIGPDNIRPRNVGDLSVQELRLADQYRLTNFALAMRGELWNEALNVAILHRTLDEIVAVGPSISPRALRWVDDDSPAEKVDRSVVARRVFGNAITEQFYWHRLRTRIDQTLETDSTVRLVYFFRGASTGAHLAYLRGLHAQLAIIQHLQAQTDQRWLQLATNLRTDIINITSRDLIEMPEAWLEPVQRLWHQHAGDVPYARIITAIELDCLEILARIYSSPDLVRMHVLYGEEQVANALQRGPPYRATAGFELAKMAWPRSYAAQRRAVQQWADAERACFASGSASALRPTPFPEWRWPVGHFEAATYCPRIIWHRVADGLRNQGVGVMLALERYRRRHGEYPRQLTDLTPLDGPANIIDPLSGRPFGYLLIPDTHPDSKLIRPRWRSWPYRLWSSATTIDTSGSHAEVLKILGGDPSALKAAQVDEPPILLSPNQ
ncbi:MAG: hypothetical protein MUE97_01765 [Phycisphaerales bacterium]|nr:hypothetical protein [Phycisphaerales bacterium]